VWRIGKRRPGARHTASGFGGRVRHKKRPGRRHTGRRPRSKRNRERRKRREEGGGVTV
jgi:hypothetical protein